MFTPTNTKEWFSKTTCCVIRNKHFRYFRGRAIYFKEMDRTWNGMLAGYLCSCITDCRRWKVAASIVSGGLEFCPRWCVFVVMWPLLRWRTDIWCQFCETAAQGSCVQHLHSFSFFHYGDWNTWLVIRHLRSWRQLWLLYVPSVSAFINLHVDVVWISEQTAIISLYNINWLVCITETECVYCAVRTEL